MFEGREVIRRDDRRRLRPVHLEHHAIEAAGLAGIAREPFEERRALERLEGGALAGESVVEMRPHVGKIVVEEDCRGAGVVRRMRAEQPTERREREVPARRLGHDTQRRERAQQPIEAIGDKAAPRGNRSVVGKSILHHIGEAEPREGSDRARDP